LGACREGRQEIKKHNPHQLRYKNGQTIVFNAARDIIFYDLPSIFYITSDVTAYRRRKVKVTHFHGFSDIQNFALQLPCLDGVYGPSKMKERLFTGLKNTDCDSEGSV